MNDIWWQTYGEVSSCAAARMGMANAEVWHYIPRGTQLAFYAASGSTCRAMVAAAGFGAMTLEEMTAQVATPDRGAI